jgi:hypothetical protein
LEIILKMEQEAITQRVKFLVESLAESVRGFSLAIGEKPTNTSNYVTGRNKPSAEFLERIILHFGNVNAHWLITGGGEPFLSPPTENTLSNVNDQKFFRSQVTGTNNGPNNQQQHNTNPSASTQDPDLKTKLTLAEQEIQHLRTQLEMQAALLAAKDETIGLLRGSYRNPN